MLRTEFSAHKNLWGGRSMRWEVNGTVEEIQARTYQTIGNSNFIYTCPLCWGLGMSPSGNMTSASSSVKWENDYLFSEWIALSTSFHKQLLVLGMTCLLSNLILTLIAYYRIENKISWTQPGPCLSLPALAHIFSGVFLRPLHPHGNPT